MSTGHTLPPILFLWESLLHFWRILSRRTEFQVSCFFVCLFFFFSIVVQLQLSPLSPHPPPPNTLWLSVLFLTFMLEGVLWASFMCILRSDINMRKCSVIIVSIFVFYFWYSLIQMLHLLKFSQCLNVVVHFFQSVISLLFLVFEMFAPVMSLTVLLISSISFWFFLRISISLLTLPFCSWILSTRSIRALSILVITVFKFGLIIVISMPYLSLVLMLALNLQTVYFVICFAL